MIGFTRFLSSPVLFNICPALYYTSSLLIRRLPRSRVAGPVQKHGQEVPGRRAGRTSSMVRTVLGGFDAKVERPGRMFL